MTAIALITGANKGIGYEIARQLGARGYTILVGARDGRNGRDAERSLRTEGVEATFVHLDVTDDDTIDRAAKWIEADYGRLDVLVNNAGIARGRGGASDTSVDVMRQVYETNVFGVVAVTNSMLPLLRRAPTARIVNVSSEVGSITAMTEPGSPLWAMSSLPYPSSKTALNMITALYAKDLHDTPIKINAANPGYCATDLNGHSGPRTAEQGAEEVTHLATVPDDGPNGVLWGDLALAVPGQDSSGQLPW